MLVGDSAAWPTTDWPAQTTSLTSPPEHSPKLAVPQLTTLNTSPRPLVSGAIAT